MRLFAPSCTEYVVVDAGCGMPNPFADIVRYTVSVNAFVADCGTASVTCTVKLKTPVAVGVPLSTPSEPSVSPPGSAPAVTLHE